jgi:tight adherence protein C
MLNPVRRRLKALRDPDEGLITSSSSAVTRKTPALWRLFEPGKEGDREGYRLKLVQAGYRSSTALGVFFVSKVGLTVLLPAATAIAVAYGAVKLDTLELVGSLAGAAFIGSLLPDFYLGRRFEARKIRLMEGLPDALDLLVTCTEAGLGLNAAMERVVEQLPAASPELAFELGQVNAEIRAGIDRNIALKNLGSRTGVEEIHGLVSLISHSTRLGTGVAGTLRIYADEFRDRRMQRAEELAAMVGTKLLFPLLLCMFPCFFVVAVGPAVISVLNAMK